MDYNKSGYPHPQPPPQYGIPAQYEQGGQPPIIIEQQQGVSV